MQPSQQQSTQTQPSLKDIGRGFSNPTLCSQAVFRQALEALSLPGQLQTLDLSLSQPALQVPQHAHAAAAALLLALLDQDCKVWLSEGFASSYAGPWLRFHTGCTVVTEPGHADFVWVADARELPALELLAQGSAQYPELSATCVVQVTDVDTAPTAEAWTLSGPGVNGTRPLTLKGLPDNFVSARRAGQIHAPCGLDFFFTHHDTLIGLPRSTQVKD
jgi:alpha-D-ribose 1-methylphosphonate 5-triphosphate synthase subunit PhnH